jgi:MFS family permease
MQNRTPVYYLPVLVIAQFLGTSVWFAGNAVINELLQSSGSRGIANSSSFVQFGFITGTFVFALLAIADRLKPTLVFFISSLFAAAANGLLLWQHSSLEQIELLRFLTGFFLAGIYPVGMKIAADLFPQKLGNALGFLVGALVLGTALPHLLKSSGVQLPWRSVISITSLLCSSGGLAVYLLIPSRPSGSKSKFELGLAGLLFRERNFRAAAFGYFGHMWELYALWTFIPLILAAYNQWNAYAWNISLWSFGLIASGSISCVAGGYISKRKGSRYVATWSLLLSGFCCLLAPFSFHFPPVVFGTFLLVWCTTVVSDSPQFSTLVATAAPKSFKGTALTMVTCIGFFLTIISIQTLKATFTLSRFGTWILVLGPLFGLIGLIGSWKPSRQSLSIDTKPVP